jgi:hypothetical protein
MRRFLDCAVTAGLGRISRREPKADDWAAEAVAFREAANEAGRLGIFESLRFWDEDIVFEERIAAVVIHGREHMCQFATDTFGATDPGTAMAYFLSADEARDQYNWSPFLELDWLDRVQIGKQGTRLMVTGVSIEGFREPIRNVVTSSPSTTWLTSMS